tara:strand:+ start:57988 stop:58137 length:150 start_codon:yes stop_codon:yes gene_type:complete
VDRIIGRKTKKIKKFFVVRKTPFPSHLINLKEVGTKNPGLSISVERGSF